MASEVVRYEIEMKDPYQTREITESSIVSQVVLETTIPTTKKELSTIPEHIISILYLGFFQNDQLTQLVILLHQSSVHLPQSLHLLSRLAGGAVAAHRSFVTGRRRGSMVLEGNRMSYCTKGFWCCAIEVEAA